MLSSISTKHLARGICGFNNVDILKGRPYGGCAVFWRHAKVVDVDTGSNRICAVQFVTSQHKLLIINVYMPFEYSHIDTDEYSFQLAIINDLMDKCGAVCGCLTCL